MTNPTDTHDIPAGSDDLEARLRATFEAAAPADTGVDAGLDDLRSRLDGDLTLTTVASDHGRRRLLLAAAAIVVVVAAVAALALRGGSGGSDGTSLATDPPKPPTTPTVLEVPTTPAPQVTTTSTPTSPGPTNYAAADSGWYVPVGLPAGWSVVSVDVGQRKLPGSIPAAGQSPPDDVTTVVSVVLGNPAGDLVGYALTAPGQGLSFDSYASPQEYRAEGQVAALQRYAIDGPEGAVLYRFTGSWPNADIVLGDDTVAGEVADPSEDDLILLASLLRPASTDEWRAFVEGAEVGPAVSAAAGLPDIIA